jgi:hypothetical protein
MGRQIEKAATLDPSGKNVALRGGVAAQKRHDGQDCRSIDNGVKSAKIIY